MRKLAALGALVIMLAGCAQATGEQAFIDGVKPNMRPIDDPKGLVDIGRQICKTTKTAKDETQTWADAGFRDAEAKALVRVAVETLCPERKAWLNG
jgi:hypothetical protein